MVLYRTQFVFKTTDGNSENFVTNTWYCLGVDPDDLDDFNIALRALYNTWRPQMSALIGQNNHEIKSYDMEDPEPRAPIVDTTFNLTSAPAGGSLPPEVSLCLSYQAPKVSGLPQARRRGRIFLPPMNGNAVDTTTGRPAAAAVTAAVACGDNLLTAAAAGTWDWAVYSTVNGAGVAVTNGWVDNEFDTQRRRGRLPSFRTAFN